MVDAGPARRPRDRPDSWILIARQVDDEHCPLALPPILVDLPVVLSDQLGGLEEAQALVQAARLRGEAIQEEVGPDRHGDPLAVVPDPDPYPGRSTQVDRL